MSMESKVAAKAGEPVSVAVVVSSRGTGKKMMLTAGGAGVAGVAGQVAAESVLNRKGPGTPGDRRGHMVMAITPTRLVFYTMKHGLLTNSPGDFLAEHPRDSLASFEVGSGKLTAELSIEFQDGTVYALEVPKVGKGKAERISKELTGA